MTAFDEDGWPSAFRELDATLAVHSQFVLHGNVHDYHLARSASGDTRPQRLPTHHLLWRALERSGFDYLLWFDQIDGFTVHPAGNDEAAAAAARAIEADLSGTPSLAELRGILRQVADPRKARGACVIDYASRLPVDLTRLDSTERDFFAFCMKLARSAVPRSGPPHRPQFLFNPLIWLVERELDLPVWFTADNERIRVIGVPRPDLGDREVAARLLAARLDGDDPDAERHHRAFAERSEGLSLRDMEGAVRLAQDQGLGAAGLVDAVRMYKLGVRDDPWRQGYVRSRIVEGEKHVATRVLGQPQPVTKTLDILKRAALGLSGAQARASADRPRGVLFFAGPSGVGKTELAKAVADLVFGDDAVLRFDMSEFAAEHSGDRLIGAPPGYVGYEVGGELTNAVRQQPFRVVLFDEIEKAHPRILDKLLQVLEDGRLTDGRGVTTYFSGCVLIFTSNLGVTETDPDTRLRRACVSQTDPYETVERLVRDGVARHFTEELGRPELLNRFGNNIVVFGFISPEAARAIFDSQLGNILRQVGDLQGIEVVVSDAAREQLCGFCTKDLSTGGRGIGMALESYLINPLARALFDTGLAAGDRVVVSSVVQDGPGVRLELG